MNYAQILNLANQKLIGGLVATIEEGIAAAQAELALLMPAPGAADVIGFRRLVQGGKVVEQVQILGDHSEVLL